MCQTYSETGCCGGQKLQTVSLVKKFLIFLALILASVSLSVALWLRIARLGSRRFVLGVDDQRTIWAGNGDFSTTFCSEYELKVKSTSSFDQSKQQGRDVDQGFIDAYMFLDYPKRRTTYTNSREYTINLTSSTDYVYWAYHLNNPDSLFLRMTSSTCSNLTMYRLTENNFLQWMDDSQRGVFCSECISQTYRPPCILNKMTLELLFSDEVQSEYIFLFQDQTLSPNSSLTAKFYFTLSRENLIIDDDDVAGRCMNATTCRLDVVKPADSIIFNMEAHASASSVTLETGCVPNVGMYSGYFLAAPLAIWSIFAGMAGFILLLIKCQDDVILYAENTDNARTMARLSTGPPPAYSNDTRTAPSSQTQSRFAIFSRGTPRQQQLPLINYEVTSDESEQGVSRTPPAYGTLDRVSVPRSEARMESQFEMYASTPPPDYSDALSRCSSQDGDNAVTTA